jgi:hypothetical protein
MWTHDIPGASLSSASRIWIICSNRLRSSLLDHPCLYNQIKRVASAGNMVVGRKWWRRPCVTLAPTMCDDRIDAQTHDTRPRRHAQPPWHNAGPVGYEGVRHD